jgi:lipoic acid synthetase
MKEKKKININDLIYIKRICKRSNLNTICISAKCPNISECFNKGIITFLILGKSCTRNCSFCSVDKRMPHKHINKTEPLKIVKLLNNLKCSSYIVITSVTRDDLQDYGANHFSCTITTIKNSIPNIKIEALVPDFMGKTELIDIILNAKPDVFAHNLETVPDLYKKVRIGSDYERSINVLKYAKKLGFKIKTGIMLGLGETKSQIIKVLHDINSLNIDILTIGQYPCSI